MVLILTPPNNEVKNISAIGNNVIVNKKINDLSYAKFYQQFFKQY